MAGGCRHGDEAAQDSGRPPVQILDQIAPGAPAVAIVQIGLAGPADGHGMAACLIADPQNGVRQS